MTEIEVLTALEKNLNAVTQAVTAVTETVTALKELVSRREQPHLMVVGKSLEELLTIKEAAAELKISQNSVRKLLCLNPQKDGLRSKKVGHNVRISRGDLLDYLERQSS